jgi:hypothetical protein
MKSGLAAGSWGAPRNLAATIVGTLLGTGVLRAAPGGPTPGSTPTAPTVKCAECHDCDRPSAARPCLRRGTCGRHRGMTGLSAKLGPKVVILDELESLYGPVRFEHYEHARMTGFDKGCETCHHFSPPNSPHPACKSCHPREVSHENLRKRGLKGAYHRICLNCHRKWDADTACEICHAKKRPGLEAPIHATSSYRPLKLNELIVFHTGHDGGDDVPFHHRSHSQLYERDCTECHREQSCERCHVQGEKPHPMGDPSRTNLHDVCFRCHGQERCSSCHGRPKTDLFNHESTGWPLKAYHANLRCRSCHGHRGAFMKLEPRCANCHPGGWNAASFDHSKVGVPLNGVHREAGCTDCHTAGVGTPATCAGCHDDGRRYTRETGFGG